MARLFLFFFYFFSLATPSVYDTTLVSFGTGGIIYVTGIFKHFKFKHWSIL